MAGGNETGSNFLTEKTREIIIRANLEKFRVALEDNSPHTHLLVLLEAFLK